MQILGEGIGARGGHPPFPPPLYDTLTIIILLWFLCVHLMGILFVIRIIIMVSRLLVIRGGKSLMVSNKVHTYGRVCGEYTVYPVPPGETFCSSIITVIISLSSLTTTMETHSVTKIQPLGGALLGVPQKLKSSMKPIDLSVQY